MFLALDPGITTGRSLGIIYEDHLLISCSQDKWNHRECYEFISKIKPDHLIVESFEYRNMRRDNLELYSRELIGIAHLIDQQSSNIKLHMQTAAQGKGFYSDQKLKAMGTYDRSNRHGRDAMRHLLHWWTFGAGYQFNNKESVILVNELQIRGIALG